MNATFKPITKTIATHYKGFWEYLPASYGTDPLKVYPVILFFHGIEEYGDGSATALQTVLKNGLPNYISKGTFPDVTLGYDGVPYEFIIICPQVSSRGFRSAGEINTLWNYITTNYRADTKRLYLTGLSYGGGATELYPSISTTYGTRIAAMAPICGNLGCTGLSGAVPYYQSVIDANLPCLFVHNNQDPTVNYNYSKNWVAKLNGAVPPINPPAILITRTSTSHNAWTYAYNPANKVAAMGGGNVYQWMLKYTR
jgi:predicted peptidase